MSDIEDFLRRAAQRRRSGQRQQPLVEIIEQPVEAEIIEAEPVSGDDVAQHVDEHLSRAKFEQRTSELGERVGMADDKLEARLQQTFEHKVGRLQEETPAALTEAPQAAATGTQKSPPPIAAQLLWMLKKPQTVQHAVILSEIFQRPEDRW